MANRNKEDKKIEKAIRSLVKLPENKRCINCKSLGPQYVCTTFWTFVCTNCSGVHREFTHRVKSVSIAKFTTDEVSALHAGGNEKARQVFFKDWDFVRNSYPESSNIPKLRNFIKDIYVDRRYTCERKGNQFPTPVLTDKEESSESSNTSSLSFGARTPNERRYTLSYSERSSPVGNGDERCFRDNNDETISPRIRRGGRSVRSSPKFEIVDDRFRDEEWGRRRRSIVERSYSLNLQRYGQGSQSLIARHSVGISAEKNIAKTGSSPTVRPVADIIGENSLPLMVGDNAQSKEKEVEVSLKDLKDQRNVDVWKASESIIDLSDNFQTPGSAAASESQPLSQSNNDSNWASFEFADTGKAGQASSINSIEGLLFELAGPSSPSPFVHTPEVPFEKEGSSAQTADILSAARISPSVAVWQTDSPQQGNPYTLHSVTVSKMGSPPHGLPAALPVALRTSNVPVQSSDGLHVQRELNSDVDYNKITNEPWASSYFPNTQVSFATPLEERSGALSAPAQDLGSGVEFHSSSPETKTQAKKELSAELFSKSYSSIHRHMGGWQNIQPQCLGFSMEHYPMALAPAYPTTANSTNPFDITDGRTQCQFPSMASLQVALPGSTAPIAGIWHASSSGNAIYPPPITHQPQFAPAVPNSTYMQQVKNYMPPNRAQGIRSSGSGNFFSISNSIQQTGGSQFPPTPPDGFYSKGGNPFG